MKKIAAINLFVVLALLAGSCATNNNVVSNRLITKRKYTKGFHINKKSKLKAADARENEDVAKEETPTREREVLPASPVRSEREVRPVSDVATTNMDNVVETEVSNEEATSANSKRKPSKENPAAVVNEKAPMEPVVPSRKELKKDIRKEARNQKRQSNNGTSDSMFILAVIFAILIPPVGVAIYTNIDWLKVLICLLLCILFWLPGMIYALLVVFDVI